MTLCTGVLTREVPSAVIDDLYKDKQVAFKEDIAPNTYIILNTLDDSTQSAIGRADGKGLIHLISARTQEVFGIKPRNKEQRMLFDGLLNSDIRLQIVLGHAGTGKTIITSAAALQKVIEEQAYKRLILTKPLSTVGPRGGVAAVPGDIREKIEPYLINFRSNFDVLLNGRADTLLQMLEAEERIQYIPIQLMRGASFNDAFIVADEMQNLTTHEMKTLCTRVGENSKIVLLGDPAQVDDNRAKDDSGLLKLANSTLIQASPLTSTIQLIQGERSELAELVAKAL